MKKMEVALHSLHSELQESAKKLENHFCSSLHFLFLTAAIFADFCIFYVPHRPSAYYLAVIIGGIRIDYQLLIFADFTLCIGK